MNYHFHKPSAPLDLFVDYFFSFEGISADHNAERFIPDGNVELLIDLKDGPQPIFDNDSLEEIQICRHVWTSGLRTKPITIPSSQDSAMIVVGFRKGLAYPFFPFPMDEISDSVVDADLIWGRQFSSLRERLLGIESPVDRFLALEDFLVTILRDADGPNRCVSYAVDELFNHPIDISLSSLTDKIGYSQKHFISMFRKCVGVTPKAFQRVMRFRSVVEEIFEADDPDWTDVALKCGYYDQAHFINDFRKFSGFTPSEYQASKSEDPSYIPVG